MEYSEDESMVRVDFFKESGKWYCTEAVRWTGGWSAKEILIQDAFRQSLRDHLQGTRLNGMLAVCLEPHHELTHPLMVRVGDD